MKWRARAKGGGLWSGVWTKEGGRRGDADDRLNRCGCCAGSWPVGGGVWLGVSGTMMQRTTFSVYNSTVSQNTAGAWRGLRGCLLAGWEGGGMPLFPTPSVSSVSRVYCGNNVSDARGALRWLRGLRGHVAVSNGLRDREHVGHA